MMGNACKFTKIRFVLSHPYLAAAAAAGANMRNAAGQPKDTILERRREDIEKGSYAKRSKLALFLSLARRKEDLLLFLYALSRIL